MSVKKSRERVANTNAANGGAVRGYRVAAAAEIMGVSQATLERWIAAGELESIKIGRCRIITATAINRRLGVA